MELALLFYDFEVFKHNWLICAINPITRERTAIWDSQFRFEKFYEKHKGDIWCGYNSRGYDTYIAKSILAGYNPYQMSEWIIAKKRKGHEFSSALNRFPLINFDCMVGFHGLKTVEAFMGKSIDETEVPFNIDRPLTPEEKAKTEKYCFADVEHTMEVFAEQKQEFTSYMALLKLFDLPLSYVGKTKAQLSAAILGARRVKRNDEFDIHFPDNLRIGRYQAVLDYFKNDWNYDTNLVIDIAGIPHVFASGGIHGAKGNVKRWYAPKSTWIIDSKLQIPYWEDGEFLHIDVASYYPTLMEKYPEYCMSRNVPDPKKFGEIKALRLKYKREKNPVQAPLKIVINGTFGATKDPMNPLYDPRQSNHTCIWGQLFLVDLIDKLEDHCEIINTNTDGLIVKINNNYDEIVSIVREFEKRTHLEFEIDRATKMRQRNVNNYLCVMEDGKVETKGGMLKQGSPLDNDLPIISEAVMKALLGEATIEETIYNCHELIKFQKIFKLTDKYDHCLHNNTEHTNKAYRVFASLDCNDTPLYKCREGSNPALFANCPERVKIINSNIEGLTRPDWLDLSWYVTEANKRLKVFKEAGEN